MYKIGNDNMFILLQYKKIYIIWKKCIQKMEELHKIKKRFLVSIKNFFFNGRKRIFIIKLEIGGGVLVKQPPFHGLLLCL